MKKNLAFVSIISGSIALFLIVALYALLYFEVIQRASSYTYTFVFVGSVMLIPVLALVSLVTAIIAKKKKQKYGSTTGLVLGIITTTIVLLVSSYVYYTFVWYEKFGEHPIIYPPELTTFTFCVLEGDFVCDSKQTFVIEDDKMIFSFKNNGNETIIVKNISIYYENDLLFDCLGLAGVKVINLEEKAQTICFAEPHKIWEFRRKIMEDVSLMTFRVDAEGGDGREILFNGHFTSISTWV